MDTRDARTARKPAAALAHVFTGFGVVCAFFAMLALIDRQFEAMFLWLGLALLIDGADGALARWLDVEHRLPRFSGERLDLVIDYVTYVFIPALALVHAGFLGGIVGHAAAVAILLSSLFHFSDLESKDDAHNFVGFPALWNVVALYVFAFALPEAGVLLVVAACVALTFVPARWVHPLRVVALRPVTLAMTGLWIAAAAIVLWQGFPAGVPGGAGLLVAAFYFVTLSALSWTHFGTGNGSKG